MLTQRILNDLIKNPFPNSLGKTLGFNDRRKHLNFENIQQIKPRIFPIQQFFTRSINFVGVCLHVFPFR